MKTSLDKFDMEVVSTERKIGAEVASTLQERTACGNVNFERLACIYLRMAKVKTMECAIGLAVANRGMFHQSFIFNPSSLKFCIDLLFSCCFML